MALLVKALQELLDSRRSGELVCYHLWAIHFIITQDKHKEHKDTGEANHIPKSWAKMKKDVMGQY